MNSFLKKLVLAIFFIFLTLACLVSVLGFVGNLNIYFELLSHTRIIQCMAFFILTVLSALLKRKIATMISIAFLLLNCWLVLNYYLPTNNKSPSTSTKISILQLNVQGGLNSNFDKTIQLIDSKIPHIVALTEITPTWGKYLNRTLSSYPYRVVEPRLGGVAIYSKLPLIDAEVRHIGKIRRPRIVAKTKVDNSLVKLIFAHPVIPTRHSGLRNKELEKIAEESKSYDGPVVVFGDLNTTPWSYYFHKLLAEGELRDSQPGFGIQPSWSDRWLLPLFPIDHLLVSKEFCVLERKTLNSIQSDHLPVFATIQLRDSKPRKN